jgi:hypothetical protein
MNLALRIVTAPRKKRIIRPLQTNVLSRRSVMEVAHGEMVEKELDILIERRSRKGEVDPDEREELWKESVRRYNARRQEENRLAWCDYFGRLAASLRSRAEEYDHRAQALLEDRGEGGLLG